MKIYWSPSSPYTRKVMACAIELGVEKRIERLPNKVHMINRDAEIVALNPLGQLPTFIADDGTVIFDSRVICEYLEHTFGKGRLFPAPGPARWQALTEQSLCDGVLVAAMLARQENGMRPEAKRWKEWTDAQFAKINDALDRMQKWVPGFAERVDIGTIATGCALGYLDFRYPDFDWRSSRPALSGWWKKFGEHSCMHLTQHGERNY
jgi:glutathione S-transferase